MTTPWRNDRDLVGKLHPQHPDDVQVIVHDGEPRRTRKSPEACWVRITGTGGVLRSPLAQRGATAAPTPSNVQWLERTIYTGQLLNQPHGLTTVREGATVRFVHAPGIPNPLMITPGYESERPRWAVTPCDRCGADQALDPMSVMAKTRFPDMPPDAAPVAFTAFCPCGGTMMLGQIEGAGASVPPPAAQGGLGGSPSVRASSAFGSSGPTEGSFAPPANAPVQPASGDGSGTRVLLYSALGCLGLVSMCCLSSFGGFYYQRWSLAENGRQHAERLLGLVQQHQWASALAAAEYGGGADLYSVETFGACMTATPLFEMTSYECTDASGGWPLDDGAEVRCTVTTSRGPTEITVTVNSTSGAPYLGYVWFSPDAMIGPPWHGEDCARWSGHSYDLDPPAGRVRP
jgi:hypothetical protein